MTAESELAELTAWVMRLFVILGMIFLIGIIALGIHVIPIYLSHNSAAQHCLDALSKLPLPPNATSGTKDWEIGGYEGAGQLCEAMAFIVIKSDAPKDNILDFYNTRFPALGKELGADCHVVSFDNLPDYGTPSEITTLAEHTALNQRSSTYAIWVILPLEDRSWDIRGW